MNDDKRFDDCARVYDDTVQSAITASGEAVQFFAELKVGLMEQLLGGYSPATILDFGCGIGNTTRAIGEKFPNSRIFGFDVSAESIAIARRRLSDDRGRFEFAMPTGDRMPFNNGSIAAAFTSCVFHHIEPTKRDHWARELRRVLAPDAPLFLFEHNPYNPLTVRVVRRVPFDEGVVLLKPRDARDLLHTAGFVTSRPWFYFFFPAFLRVLRAAEPALKRIPFGAQYFVVGR